MEMLTGVPGDVVAAIPDRRLRQIRKRHVPYRTAPGRLLTCQGCYDHFGLGRWKWPCPTFTTANEALRHRKDVTD